MRSATRHAPGAYLASRTATRELCSELDAGYAWKPVNDEALEAARVAYNSCVAEVDKLGHSALDLGATPVPQKALSLNLDTTLQRQFIAESTMQDKARLQATAAPHASAWLNAPPCTALGLRMSHHEFCAGLKLWLGCDVLPHDTWCPKCDQILYRKGLHCFACMNDGDATRLHNSLMDGCFHCATAAGLGPEKEKARVLPSDPRRRPGDIFIASWPRVGAIAMDFAFTSPMQRGILASAANRKLAAATHLSTESTPTGTRLPSASSSASNLCRWSRSPLADGDSKRKKLSTPLQLSWPLSRRARRARF